MRQDEERRVNRRPCRLCSNITWRSTSNTFIQKLTKQETNLAEFTQKVKLCSSNVCDNYYDDGYYKDNKNRINLKHAWQSQFAYIERVTDIPREM